MPKRYYVLNTDARGVSYVYPKSLRHHTGRYTPEMGCLALNFPYARIVAAMLANPARREHVNLAARRRLVEAARKLRIIQSGGAGH